LRKALDINGYLSIIIGMFITLMVQSSSITTSALTPLAAVGIISLEQMYPLTLGANIGTTCTGIWAASVAVSHPVEAWQVALSHLFFNIFGICIWYPIPYMRNIPLNLARRLGEYTSKWTWFPLAYVAVCFFAIPGIAYGIASSA
jgi:sodium-dependent phosphate cotransporter